jgi:pantoate--beta-alanine ligase
MGYLHAGHLSMIHQSRAENAHTVVSIFVNPAQFNNPQDLSSYPRDEARDLAMLQEEGVDLVFLPEPLAIYPPGFQTYVTVENLSQGLEGAHRPGHFRGVTTVVAKLFNLVGPERAYFGQKDAQQAALIQQMARDLNFPLEVKICPTIREADGLAMSSRNSKLSPVERSAAPVIYQALLAAKRRYENGERHPDALRSTMQSALEMESMVKVDYLSVADPLSLQEYTESISGPVLISLAAHIGRTRLIDNLLLG